MSMRSFVWLSAVGVGVLGLVGIGFVVRREAGEGNRNGLRSEVALVARVRPMGPDLTSAGGASRPLLARDGQALTLRSDLGSGSTDWTDDEVKASQGGARRAEESAGQAAETAEWTAQAARVELEATHELERLVALLDLTGPQQDHIFDYLARRSSSWRPGMQTSGGEASMSGDGGSPLAPAVTGEESGAPSVADFLTADQEQVLVEDEMDRHAWWQEILPQLLPPEVAPSVSAGTDEPTPPPLAAPKSFDGETTLLGD
jgi:hypothetical protein